MGSNLGRHQEDLGKTPPASFSDQIPHENCQDLGDSIPKKLQKFQSKPSLHIADIFHYISSISPLHLLYCWLFIMLKHTQRTRCCFYIPLSYMNLHEITLKYMNLHEITLKYMNLHEITLSYIT